MNPLRNPRPETRAPALLPLRARAGRAAPAGLAALAGILGFGALGALTGCHGSEPGPGDEAREAEPPPLVRTRGVEMRPVRRSIETTSYLQSEHSIAVLPKVSGRVEEVLVDEGDEVRKGQVLARLDDRVAAASVKQAEVQLADRRVRLELQRLEAEAAKRRVQQKRIERDQAKADHERNQRIDPELIAESEMEDSRFALERAEEALSVAQYEERKAQLEIEAAKGLIADLDARLEIERIRLEDHEVRSPIDGMISECLVRGGENVSVSNSLTSAPSMFRIFDHRNLVAYLSRPQRELPVIRDAREVTFTTDAYPERRFTARIDLLFPVVDEETGSFRVRIRVAKEDAELLRPGMFVRARILTEDERQALMVPKAAVVNDGDTPIVYAVRDNVARRVVLDPGLEERDYIECKNLGDQGLAPDDRVVVAGQHDLKDRTAVEVSNS